MARRQAYSLEQSPVAARERLYVVARTAGGRPTLQHLLPPGVGSVTACGVEMEEWSRAYMRAPVPEILCLRSACRS